MKATGIVRRVDDFGRIVLPKEIRTNFGMHVGEPVEIFVSGDSVVLKRYDSGISVQEKVEELSIAVDDISTELGMEKTEKVKKYLNEIESLLKK